MGNGNHTQKSDAPKLITVKNNNRRLDLIKNNEKSFENNNDNNTNNNTYNNTNYNSNVKKIESFNNLKDDFNINQFARINPNEVFNENLKEKDEVNIHNCKCNKTKEMSMCKDEDYSSQSLPYILGLNSSLINGNLVASSRPSSCFLTHYKLIKQFKMKNISLIINLQRPGEHPFCGPQKKLEPNSGFSYLPDDFIMEDIECKTYGWRDMTAPGSIEFVLNIAKEISSVLQNPKKRVRIVNINTHIIYNILIYSLNKVFIHCHSGLNRSTLIIACYIIFESNNNKSLETILSEIREIRPNSLDKDKYINFCKKFKHCN